MRGRIPVYRVEDGEPGKVGELDAETALELLGEPDAESVEFVIILEGYRGAEKTVHVFRAE